MKGCELCNGVARMYCESDDASLCWNCDEKVHCANFLVAKHCRSLLCQICQSPTAWKASGPKLGPTVSICHSCFPLRKGRKSEIGCHPEESHNGKYPMEYDSLDEQSDLEEGEDDDEEEEEEGEEEEENQVVPWSVTSVTVLPLASSSNDDVSSKFGSSVSKRMREDSTDLESDDDRTVCSSRRTGFGKLSNDERSPKPSNRPLKRGRTGVEDDDQNDGDGKKNQNPRPTHTH